MTQRQERERAFWNEHSQADEYATWQEFPLERWRTNKPINRAALDHLGPVDGKRVLMPGVGPQAIQFARAGAEVWGFDISERQVAAVEAVVERYGLTDRIHLAAMPFEILDYQDAMFDVAFGNAILHHIDLDAGAAELKRVLRPGGRASFIEPLASNPLLEFARKHVPYPGKGRTEDEAPLTYRDIRTFTGSFAASNYREFNLFAMVAPRLIRDPGLGRRLRQLDERILSRAPALRRLCQLVWVGVET